MMRKTCPQCAERVRSAAVVCRFCNHKFSQDLIEKNHGIDVPWRLIVVAAGVLIVGTTAWLIYSIWADLEAIRSAEAKSSELPHRTAQIEVQRVPTHEVLRVGTTLEWTADQSPAEVVRQAGPYVLKITKKFDGETVAPVIKLVAGSQEKTLEGASTWGSLSHRISLITNRRGAVPILMFQSFSGGAHCCNRIQLAGFSKGKLSVVDLGSWDGEYVDLPSDISGDGVTDIVLSDDRFLYAFAGYAVSYAPPRIFNVVDGQIRDVSNNPSYKPLFDKFVGKVQDQCSPGGSANGACPAYVAAAARIGKLNQAWADMVAAYDPATDWDLPTGCTSDDSDGCPKGSVVNFKSYPEALQYFLKRNGYVSRAWQPPESFNADAMPSSNDTNSWTT